MSPVQRTTRAIRQPQPLQNIFGVRGQLLEFVVTLVGRREFHQLYFLKLVLPDNAPHIAAIGARLAAKTGRVSARQSAVHRIQRLIAKQVGDRHFRGGRKPKSVPSQLEQIFGKFRQLPGAEQARRIDQKRRQHFACSRARACAHRA